MVEVRVLEGEIRSASSVVRATLFKKKERKYLEARKSIKEWYVCARMRMMCSRAGFVRMSPRTIGCGFMRSIRFYHGVFKYGFGIPCKMSTYISFKLHLSSEFLRIASLALCSRAGRSIF